MAREAGACEDSGGQPGREEWRACCGQTCGTACEKEWFESKACGPHQGQGGAHNGYGEDAGPIAPWSIGLAGGLRLQWLRSLQGMGFAWVLGREGRSPLWSAAPRRRPRPGPREKFNLAFGPRQGAGSQEFNCLFGEGAPPRFVDEPVLPRFLLHAVHEQQPLLSPGQALEAERGEKRDFSLGVLSQIAQRATANSTRLWYASASL